MADDSQVGVLPGGATRGESPSKSVVLTGADGRLPGNLTVGISDIEPGRAPGTAQTPSVRAAHRASPDDAAAARPAPDPGLTALPVRAGPAPGCPHDAVLEESVGAVLAVRHSRDDGEPLLLLHGGPAVPDYLQAATAPLLPRYRS